MSDVRREIAAIKTLGARMRESRGLCKHTINIAAQLLGISADELKKIEDGCDTDYVPLWLVKRAAEIYHVSLDFLFGIEGEPGDWELCYEIRKQRDYLAILQRLHIENHSVVIAEQIRQDVKLQALVDAANIQIPAIVESLKAVHQAIDRFREVNPEVDDLPAGAPVLGRIREALQTVRKMTEALIRAKALRCEAFQAFRDYEI